MTRGQHVVQPAVADVVGPPVAADDPHAPLDQGVGDGEQVPGAGPVVLLQPRLEPLHALPLRGDARLGGLVRLEDRDRQLVPIDRQQAVEEPRACSACLASASRIPEAELGVVFEERVGPGGAAPSWLTVQEWSAGSRHRSTSTPSRWPRSPDRRRAGYELDVRRLPAARAGARELEQGLEELDVLDLAQFNPSRSVSGRRRKKLQFSACSWRIGGCGIMLMAL